MKSVVAVAFILLCFFAPYARADELPGQRAPFNIICIGDSITQGGNLQEEYTYRLPLYRLLKRKGVNARFIGARKDGLDAAFHWPRDFDPHHEGFYGATTDFVRNTLRSDLPKLPAPDIAIIDLGSNDEGSGDIGKSVIAPLRDIIAQLRARNPKVKILLVQIPGMFQNLGMHFGVWKMARDLNLTDSPVITIPLYWGWDMHRDTFDGSHPNISGQNRMADAIFAELEPILRKSP